MTAWADWLEGNETGCCRSVRARNGPDRHRITQAAFDAIAATMPLGSVGYEAQRPEKGEVHIWLEERWVSKLAAMRRPAKSFGDSIIRLAAGRARVIALARPTRFWRAKTNPTGPRKLSRRAS
jgi:hypothetical protein